MPDDRKCLMPPRCRYTSDEGIKQHEPGCPMLDAPAPVRPDPARYRNPVAVVTGAPLDGDHASGADIREWQTRIVPPGDPTVDDLGLPAVVHATPLRLMLEPLRPVPTRTRPGDQPLPTDDGGPAMQDLVIADIDARKQVGIERYGQTLKAFDGRDNLKDIYDELIDAAIYVRKEIYKRDGK
jgi:hypothetical protein